MRYLSVALAFVAAMAMSRVARADHARLVYGADDACPTEAAFRAKVASRLGYDPFQDDATTTVHVTMHARNGAASAEITAGTGKRTLEDTRCDALGDTAASAVALLLDPLANGAPPPAAEPLPVPPPSEAVPPPNVSAPPARERPASAEPAATVAPIVYGQFVAGFARTPATMIGARLGLGVMRGAWTFAVEGRAETSPSSAAIGDRDHIESSALSGALVPCRALSEWFLLCGVLTLGDRSVKSLDVASPRTKSAFFAEIGVRAGVELPLTSVFALRADGELGLPFNRTTYTTDGIERETTSVLEGSLGAGLVGRFR